MSFNILLFHLKELIHGLNYLKTRLRIGTVSLLWFNLLRAKVHNRKPINFNKSETKKYILKKFIFNGINLSFIPCRNGTKFLSTLT